MVPVTDDAGDTGKPSLVARLGVGKPPSWVAFFPIPALIALMAVTYFVVPPSVFYDPEWLILAGNTLFIGAICAAVSYVAFRNYNATGRIQILLLGCGVLIFGIGGVVAAVVRSMPDGANVNVTIYNTGALLGALFHGAAAFILLSGVAPEVGAERKGAWLALGYGGAVLVMALLTAASLRDVIPPFFVQGVGPTRLRQSILGTADVLFVFSSVIFFGTYLRNKEAFLYWYACALALTAISLTAFFVQTSVGSPVGWVGRCSQYFGGLYFLVSLLTAARQAQARGTSFDTALGASLSRGEEKFRALAENAPDVIRRFDRQLRHLYVNPAGLRQYGKTASAVIGRPIDRVGLDAGYVSVWTQRIEEVFRTGESIEVEESLPGAGETRFYQSRCVPEYGADGTVANVLVMSRDLTQRKHSEDIVVRAKEEGDTTVEFLRQVNAAKDLTELVHLATTFFHCHTRCEAVGIRLAEGDDYPYYETCGFPESFTRAENSLCARDETGCISRDEAGNPVLECMCGNVIAGRSDPSRSFFTPAGSFWTNSTTALPASTTEADREARTRDRCNGEGYESVALIPLVSGSQRLGLLQINDKRPGMFSPDTIAHWERLADYLAVSLARARAEGAEQRQARTVEAVNRIFEQAIRCESIEDLGLACLATAESVTSSRFGFIGEMASDGLLHCVALSNPGWEACGMPDADGGRPPLGTFAVRGLYGRVITDGTSLLTNAPASHPDRIGTPPGHPPLHAFLGVPLIQHGKTHGMIAVANRDGGYRGEDRETLEALAPAIVEAFGRKRAELSLRDSERRHKQLVESERVARSEAERANRIKDEFLANLSHELRTPLNAILGWTQILRKTPLDAAALRGLDVIERNTRSQAQLISDLLDMSRIMSGKLRLDLKHCDLATIIDSAVESLAPTAETKGIRLTQAVDRSAGTVLGDPDRLVQALWNLLANALKFTPSGGSVHVAAGPIESGVEIQIRDTGQGIDGDFLPHLFERFWQADSSATKKHGGLGLGLAIVKHIVEAHGGTIRADSPGPGRGATFTVSLPAMAVYSRGAEMAPPQPGRALIPDSIDLAGVRVLLVDDEADAREMLTRLLAERGASVAAAASAVDAINMLQGSRPDLLVADIGMPDVDGYEMMRRIRQLGPEAGGEIPAVALTAYSRPEDRTRTLLAGYEWHLTKPVEASVLIATVAMVARRFPKPTSHPPDVSPQNDVPAPGTRRT